MRQTPFNFFRNRLTIFGGGGVAGRARARHRRAQAVVLAGVDFAVFGMGLTPDQRGIDNKSVRFKATGY